MESRRHGILIGYDGSEDADAAVLWAARAARLRQEPVVVVIAEDTGADTIGLRWWPESYWRELGERAEGLLRKEGVTDVRVERHTGSLVPVLVPLADDATMLVLGSRGHGRAGQTFVGSTSAGAAGHAPCPVVVVREPAEPGSDRVVVGSDGSEGSAAALDFACRQAGLEGQRVLVLHGHGEGEGADAAAGVAAAVDRAREGHPGVPLETETVAGPPAQALVDASAAAALVVVGSRGLRAYEGQQLGSVSHDVLRRATCSVAVVR
jgi:nucleotide-binding universal stress UspA family protein